MSKYSIGIDYGTLSARALLIDLADGNEVAVSQYKYPHAVMDTHLPDGTVLGDNYALQYPGDYTEALRFTVGELLTLSGVDASDIVGIGIDFTSCTVLPVDVDGVPLCFCDEFRSEPHAYVKLWKHHSASREADEITRVAREEDETRLDIYGGKISSEMFIPKVFETYNNAPDVYRAAARFVEAGDWVTGQLTGTEVCSSCMAGYKALWNKSDGYPSKEFFKKLNPDFEHIIGDKISEKVLPAGTVAGTLCKNGAALTGLCEGTAVAVPIIDAHATLPAAGIVDEGKLMLIIGTSSCHIIMDKEDIAVPGICGRVWDGIIPGLVAYEAGQSCVGDTFDWFVKNCVPSSYEKEAARLGINVFELLQRKAEKLEVGENGLLALDWWNGNRTPYGDYDLTGAIFGYNLKTKPEDIFRALIEATAYGTKAITDLYESCGVSIDSIYAGGGIPQKNTLLVQIYADVLGKEIIVPRNQQSGALGSALFAAVAGGYFPAMKDAAKVLIKSDTITYVPDEANHSKYQKLYNHYSALSKYFAEGGNDVLKSLRTE